MITPAIAHIRADLMHTIRSYFRAKNYLEVDPPVMARTLIPEAQIEVFETALVSPYDEPEPRYLTPSPELFLKQLLANDFGSLYSIGRAFRNSESTSLHHNPEFTMLEWYGVETDASSQLTLATELLHTIAGAFPEAEGSSLLAAAPETLSIARALESAAGIAPDELRPDEIEEAARRNGIRISETESPADLFHRLLVDLIEPSLPLDRPVFLTDYPSLVPTLAAQQPDAPGFADRWELYLGGIEIANCYTEERDAAKILEFLESEHEEKARALVPHEPAMELVSFSEAPPVSGVALGVDRLLMALTAEQDIRGVIFFP